MHNLYIWCTHSGLILIFPRLTRATAGLCRSSEGDNAEKYATFVKVYTPDIVNRAITAAKGRSLRQRISSFMLRHERTG